MINANEAKMLMPSQRMDTILDEVEELIKEAASNDETVVAFPEGFFGKGVEKDIIYNAKNPPLWDYVKKSLIESGFKLGRNEQQLKLFISWED